MGASHSGKHQLGPAVTATTAAATTGKPQKQQNRMGEVQPEKHNNNNSKFGHSLRKGMGNMLLNSTSIKSSSSQLSGNNHNTKTKRAMNAIDDSLMKTNMKSSHQLTNNQAAKENFNKRQDHEESYYVPSGSSTSSASHTATATMSPHNRQQPSIVNNYVTMQQQQQQQQHSRVPMVSSSPLMMKGRMLELDENGNNGFIVSSTKSSPQQASTTTTETTTRGAAYGASATNNTTNKPMEMNSAYHNNNNNHRHHQPHHNHNRARSLASSNIAQNHLANNTSVAPDHSHHHQLMANHHHHQASSYSSPTSQQPSFHLSRAINTKTTSHVLNHNSNNVNNVNISMNNDSNSSRSGGSGSSSSSSGSSSVAMQNSGRKVHRHSHQQQISSPATPKTRAIQQQQLSNNKNNSQAHHHQHQVARANECRLPTSPYHCSPATASFVPSPHHHQQQQLQWSQQRYASAADPASTSFYSNANTSYTMNDERYLQPVDDYDSRQYQMGNPLLDQQQPALDSMGHYKPAIHQQQQQQQYQHYDQLADNNNYSSHMFQTSPVGQLPIHYNRSYSFGSSLTLDSRKIRSQNPLASLFQPLTTSSSPTAKRQQQQQQYANTIQVTRRNKSGQLSAGPNVESSTSNGRSAPGSLKRVKSSLLSAQQASYEAMRTIDMYLIRQIARSCMDFEMEQKIELEIRLRELAAQSILEARNEIDVLEVEKSLLTSDQRMNYYASHLELQRKKLSNPSLSTDSGRGSKTDATNKRTLTTQSAAGRRRLSQPRSDVIGAPAGAGSASTNGDTSSPSFSSLSNSQSPSKLSPVSGQSANESQASFTSRSHHSRTGLRHSQSSSSANNNNNNSQRARIRAKSKRREQLLQNLAKQNNLDCNAVMDSRASVSVSEIRIPLMWRDVDHFKNRGDYKRFAVFCLLKINSQIYDTQLITDVDRQVTDVTFDDFIVFNNIDYDFELTLEVYSCVYLEQFSFSSTPRKLKEKLTSSIGRAMGKRLATQTASSSYTKELQAYDKSYRFALIASAVLQLEDASNSVKTYDLVLMSPNAQKRHSTGMTLTSKSPQNPSQDLYGRNAISSSSQLTSANTNKNANKNSLPLFGHFCCRLFVRPDVFDKNIDSALI